MKRIPKDTDELVGVIREEMSRHPYGSEGRDYFLKCIDAVRTHPQLFQKMLNEIRQAQGLPTFVQTDPNIQIPQDVKYLAEAFLKRAAGS